MSNEMKDVGLMSGNATFYDYRRSVPSINEVPSKSRMQSLDRTYHKKKPVNQSMMISIGREGNYDIFTKNPY